MLLPASWASNIPTTAVELYNAGIDHYNAGRVERSIESFNRAIQLYPQFFEAYYNLGQIQAANDRLDDAIKTYTALVDMRPNDAESLFELASMLHRRGFLKRAMSYLDRIPPNSPYFTQAHQLADRISTRQAELEKEANEKKAEAERRAAERAEASSIITGIPSPAGVAADSAGNIYIASFGESTVYRINRATNQRSVFVGPETLGGPLGLAVDRNNNLYIGNYTKGNIVRVAPNGLAKVFLNIKKPYYINISGDTLFVTEQETNTTLRLPL
jgi:tetratricopeptide (TPR) repeat protein